MRAPSAALPLPGGRPVPSGRTLISQAAISRGVIGLPRFGVCAKAQIEPVTSINTMTHGASLRVYIFHLATTFNGPTCDRVVMFVRKRSDGRSLRGLSA